MKPAKNHLIIAFLLFSNLCLGQAYKAKFDSLWQAADTSTQIALLREWEVAEPQNPELYTSYFNYYFLKSKSEYVALSTTRPSGEHLSLEDSTGQVAGYFGNEVRFDADLLQQGFDKIDEGIRLFPNRLDMRFGKIYALGQVGDWDRFTAEIVKAVRYSGQNSNAWTWTYDEKKEDGEDFFLSSLQTYQLNLYETENDALLPNMRTIGEEVLKLYPEHVESLSNISITYLLTGEFDKGIAVLQRAEQINPRDGIVLGNIAHAYTLKGDKENALKYYNKMLKLDDEEAVDFAKEQIKLLKKSK